MAETSEPSSEQLSNRRVSVTRSGVKLHIFFIENQPHKAGKLV